MPWRVAGSGLFSLLLLCSCATAAHPPPIAPAAELPAEVSMNKDAGRGMCLFLMLRMEREELPFVVDTGLTITAFDKSLEKKLGKCLGKIRWKHYSETLEAGVYAAPKLMVGSTRLMTATNICSLDLKDLRNLSGRPVMGVLGMDCLRHYCIELDFDGGKIRFLAPDRLDTARAGKAFPLTFRWETPVVHPIGLAGGTNVQWLIEENSKRMLRDVRFAVFRAFGFWICFGFRISDFTFPLTHHASRIAEERNESPTSMSTRTWLE
jgi:hypothetical protein